MLFLFAVAVFLYIKSYKDSNSSLILISFGILWFFITISVESSVIPILDVIYEHRVYLPSAGLFISLALLADGIKNKYLKGRFDKISIILVSILIFILSIATFQRNKVWTVKVRFWEDVVKKSPCKMRPYNQLAVALFQKGRIDDSIKTLLRSLTIKTHNVEFRHILNQDFANAHLSLGVAYAAKGLRDKSIEEYMAALKYKPDFAKAHYNLANAYGDTGLIEKAIEHNLIAIRLNPKLSESHNNLGILYAQKGLIDKAIVHFQIAVRLDPDKSHFHENLARAYETKGFIDKAEEERHKAISLENRLKGRR